MDDRRWFGNSCTPWHRSPGQVRARCKCGSWSMVHRLLEQRILQFLPLLQVSFRHLSCQFTHPPEVGLSLRHTDRAARIQNIERLVALEHIIIRGDNESLGERSFRFGFEPFEDFLHAFDIANFIVVLAVLELLLAADFAVRDRVAPRQIPRGFDVVQTDQDAFKPIGDLDRHGIERHAAHLLEIRELRDLLPIQPDFPTQSPGRDGRLFPVVLHKADVVLARINADGFERVEIDLLRVPRVRFEDDLELIMQLKAIRVLAVTPIIGSHRRFDIRHVPRLGAEHAQKGGGIHRPCTDLGVVGLPKNTAALRPELLEGENDLLEVERHGGFSIYDFRFWMGSVAE